MATILPNGHLKRVKCNRFGKTMYTFINSMMIGLNESRVVGTHCHSPMCDM